MSSRLALVGLAAVLFSGCELFDSLAETADFDAGFDAGDASIGGAIGPDGRPLVGAVVGESCRGDASCRPGLRCDRVADATEGTCSPSGAGGDGSPCTIAGECGDGLSCGLTAQCEPSEGAGENAACSSPADCGPGLRCEVVGFAGLCRPEGTVDVGGACERSSDCLAPLGCSTNGQCQIPIYGGVPFLPEADCAPVDDTAPFEVYFELPDEGAPADFYRLPFPNDARVVSGELDIADHPNPGVAYAGGDVLDAYLSALSENFAGFSTNPTVVFRFSRSPAFGSLRGSGESPTVSFVNIDPDSPNYGRGVAYYWNVTTGRGLFVCHNYMTIHPSWSSPLEPATTYAVYMTDGIRANDQSLAQQPAALRLLLGENRPQSGRRAAAWDAWAPLRAYFDEQGIQGVNIMGATVFTTMDPDRNIPALRDAVRAEEASGFIDLTVCEEGARSPCDDGVERTCVGGDGSFVEIHGRYRAPFWQQGQRPWFLPGSGGAVDFTEGGPNPAGEETICFSMTVPTTPMPESGWPLVIYAHGTNGSFVSHVREGIGPDLANLTLRDGRTLNAVTISYDGILHGPRRGDGDFADADPENLVYNFANPDAAMGNQYQAAADLFWLVHQLQSAPVTVGDLTVAIDTSRPFLMFGHSQGAMSASFFVGHEPAIGAAVFSGHGGGLALSLLNKRSPVDIATGVRYALGRGIPANMERVSELDPMLALLQWFIDPVDPLNHAALYVRNPPIGSRENALHVLQTFGFGDTHSPDSTMAAVGGAMGLDIAIPHPGDVSGMREREYPISGNRSFNDQPITAAFVATEPDDYDGHFVTFRNDALREQVYEFVGTFFLDGVPTVPAP